MNSELCEHCNAVCDKKQPMGSRFCYFDLECSYSVVLLEKDDDERRLFIDFDRNFRDWKRWIRRQGSESTCCD